MNEEYAIIFVCRFFGDLCEDVAHRLEFKGESERLCLNWESLRLTG